MIVCQFEIGDFVCHFEGKPKRVLSVVSDLKMAADLKREKQKIKSHVFWTFL